MESVNTTARKKQSHQSTRSPGKPSSTQPAQTPANVPKQQHQPTTPIKHSFIDAGVDAVIARQAIVLGLEPGAAWLQKVLQLYTITQVKHGM